MKILTAAQMQQIDRLTSEEFGVPGLTLMETAGVSAVSVIEAHFGSLSSKQVTIFSGKGNNGGDGAVIARHLWLRGARVKFFLLGKLEDTRGDARINFEAVKKLAVVEQARLYFQEIEFTAELDQALNSQCDLYIDALFGTGAARPLTGIYQHLVKRLNESNIPLVAVDLPSGLSADNPEIIGPTLEASLTITMTAPKLANVLPPALHYNGKVVVIPIGSPNSLIDSCGAQLNLITPQIVDNFLTLSRRSVSVHKNGVGDVLIIAGGRGKTGAAGLTATAALRAGAGLVTLATPASCQQVSASSLPLEIMTEPLAETTTGLVADTALAKAKTLAEKRNVVALGPGLGSSGETDQFVHSFVAQCLCPLIIDADGLNALSPWSANLLIPPDRPTILTPHPGEMARLSNGEKPDSTTARMTIARHFATTYKVILVLKGEATLIAAPNGEIFVNPTGNAGMATAGAGDVLTGIIAGLLAQAPLHSLAATLAGVYLHGLAGDFAAKALGQRSLLAADITNHLAAAILSIGGEVEKRNFFHPLGRRNI